MIHTSSSTDSSQLHDILQSELRFQQEMLPKVSRSFALTIPQLPPALELSVTNAYLLCRIADAVEDDPAISARDTRAILAYLVAALKEQGEANTFVERAGPALSEATDAVERRLVAESDKVIRVFLALPGKTRQTISTCVEKMCGGMPNYQPNHRRGLDSQKDLDAYCYFVAGVVGEMLTGLFCDYAPDIEAQRDKLEKLSTSFGQGLQMTNIIKDVWDDLERGYCWLPRDLYEGQGYDLDRLDPGYKKELFRRCQAHLIGIAHGHLRNALDYSLCIPSRHKGIRIFCLWAVGLALPTLQKAYTSEDYYNGHVVKMSRYRALLIMQLIASSAGSDTVQKVTFKLLGHGLPMAPVSGVDHSKAMRKLWPGLH